MPFSVSFSFKGMKDHYLDRLSPNDLLSRVETYDSVPGLSLDSDKEDCWKKVYFKSNVFM